MADEANSSRLFEDWFFSQILEEDRDNIEKSFVRKEIAEGESLCSENEDINTYTFVVASGELDLYFDDTDTGEERVIRKVKKQEIIYSIFSIADMLTARNPQFPLVKAKASTTSVVHYISNHNILDLARKDSSFAFLLLQNTASHAQNIRDIIYNISGKRRKVWKPEGNTGKKHRKLRQENTRSSYNMLVPAFCTPKRIIFSWHPDFNIDRQSGVAKLQDNTEACRELMEVLQITEQHHKKCLMENLKVYKVNRSTKFAARNYEVNFIFIVDGTVKKIMDDVEEELPKSAFLGVYSVITGGSHRYDLMAGDSGCIVAIIERNRIYQLLKKNFQLVALFFYYKLRQLSPVVRLVDFAISKESVESGNAVERDDRSLLYITMGRLRHNIDQQVQSISDYSNRYREDFGRGGMIGFNDILYKKRGRQILYAVRDTHVARIPVAVFEYVVEKYPKDYFEKHRQFLHDSSRGKTSIDISTVACVRVSNGFNLDECVTAFGQALLNHGQSKVKVRNVKIRQEEDFFQHDIIPSGSYLPTKQLVNVMDTLTEDDTIYVYVANFPYKDEWSKMIIEKADVILVFGLFQNGYKADDDHKLLREKSDMYSAEKILLLLHKPNEEGRYERPTDTWKWLREERTYKSENQETSEDFRKHQISHIHIRCPNKMFEDDGATHTAIKDTTLDDFPRLARLLLGQSYGLVLGGGGAR